MPNFKLLSCTIYPIDVTSLTCFTQVDVHSTVDTYQIPCKLGLYNALYIKVIELYIYEFCRVCENDNSGPRIDP